MKLKRYPSEEKLGLTNSWQVFHTGSVVVVAAEAIIWNFLHVLFTAQCSVLRTPSADPRLFNNVQEAPRTK